MSRLAASNFNYSTLASKNSSKLLVDVHLAATADSNLINAAQPDKGTLAAAENSSSLAWFDDVEAKLRASLAKLRSDSKFASDEAKTTTNDDNDVTTRRQLAAEALAKWIQATLTNAAVSDGYEEAATLQPEVLEYLAERRPSLFTCVASTTGPLLSSIEASISSLDRTAAATADIGLRDKLANIRPAHRSILVEPMGKLVSLRC